MQSFYVTRDAEWDDVAHDAIGALIGLAGSTAWLIWRRSSVRPA